MPTKLLPRRARFALDVGTVRIGVAKSDPDGILASPVSTIEAGTGALTQVLQLITEFAPAVVYVGLPVNLQGVKTPSTQMAIAFANELAGAVAHEIEVRLIDERLSTKQANLHMRDLNISTKKSRKFIDQVAAVAILDAALDYERSHNERAGRDLATHE